MDAREFMDMVRDENEIIRLTHFPDGADKPDGRGYALIVDLDHHIAVMLRDCGDPRQTGIRAGDFVKYVPHPEAEPKIVGTPARIEE